MDESAGKVNGSGEGKWRKEEWFLYPDTKELAAQGQLKEKPYDADQGNNIKNKKQQTMVGQE